MYIIDRKDEVLIKTCELFNSVVAAAVDEGHSWWYYAGWGIGVLLVIFLCLIAYAIFEDQKENLTEANNEMRRYRTLYYGVETMMQPLQMPKNDMNNFTPTDQKTIFNKIYFLYTKGLVTPEISKLFNDHKKRTVTNKPGARI